MPPSVTVAIAELIRPNLSGMSSPGKTSQAQRLLDEVRTVARLKHYSLKRNRPTSTGSNALSSFHHKRHPAEMGESEIRQFLSHLAVRLHVSASTQTVALSPLLFLYRDVLKRPLPFINNIERAKPSRHLPVVFTREEVLAYTHTPASGYNRSFVEHKGVISTGSDQLRRASSN